MELYGAELIERRDWGMRPDRQLAKWVVMVVMLCTSRSSGGGEFECLRLESTWLCLRRRSSNRPEHGLGVDSCQFGKLDCT